MMRNVESSNMNRPHRVAVRWSAAAVVVAACLAWSASAPAAANLLIDPSFENGADANNFDPAWMTFGNVFHEPVTPRTGTYSAKLFSQFGGQVSLSGIFQDIAATEG